MTTNKTTASFTKLNDGSWGVRICGEMADQLKKGDSGQQVAVSKKDGSTETKTITRVLWVGRDNKTGNTVALAQVASDRPARSNSGFGVGRRKGGRYECEECGEYVDAGTRCWETGMNH